MHEISIKGDSPATTVAMLLSLARPHFVRVGVPANDVAESNISDTQTTKVTDRPPSTAAVETTVTTVSRTRKAKTKPVFVIKWPDATEKTFETVGEAIEEMVGALDLCDTKADVEKFLNDNIAVTETASDAVRDVLTTAANERIQDIFKAEAGEGGPAVDVLPKGDTVGADVRAKAASQQPDELSLPAHLDRRTTPDGAKVPSLDYIKRVFLKFSELNPDGVAGAQKALIDAGSTKKPPNLSSVPEANRAGLIASLRAHVPVDAVPEE